ncbi:cytochrome b5-like [Phymastichus coffea]|uniref:cytochrome b5-like n=1 Tax=Phymastichus coffea TaxID=108790 RepID=UPI00273C5A33|nr:cytochrome b5-like [Phymastichus coffea]
MSKQFTYDEVSESSDHTRTLIAVHDKVYDVTEFLNEHPGGEEVLLDHAGKDATEDFNDVGHSSDAQDLMNKYLIGEIVEAERRNLPKKQAFGYKPVDSKPDDKYVQGPGTPFLALAGAVAIVAVLFFYYVL